MPGLSISQKLVVTTSIFLVTALIACSAMAPTAAPPVTGLQAINGTKLYYEIIGKGAPLFVLHGGPGNSHSYFLPYLEPLSDEYQLFFYDQRGTGLSDGQIDPAAISIDQFVEDLEALRLSFGLEKISLMGHSWGAIIALAYALKYQAHLDHLILVDSRPMDNNFLVKFSETMQQRFQSLSAEVQQEWTTICAHSNAELAPNDLEKCIQLNAQLKFYDPAKVAAVQWATEENTLKNAVTVRDLLENNFNRVQHDLNTQLPTLRIPTLMIHGDFDAIPVESSEYLHQQIPGSQIVVITESGHFPFIEQPEQFLTAVRSFLRE